MLLRTCNHEQNHPVPHEPAPASKRGRVGAMASGRGGVMETTLYVSDVYQLWQAGDFLDAYLMPPYGAQVIKIYRTKPDRFRLTTLCTDGCIQQTSVSALTKLRIGTSEGVA